MTMPDCDAHHMPLWEAIKESRKLPLWAKICGGVFVVVLVPIFAVVYAKGDALDCKCDVLGERVRAVEVKSESTDDMLKEIRSDVKKLLTREAKQ